MHQADIARFVHLGFNAGLYRLRPCGLGKENCVPVFERMKPFLRSALILSALAVGLSACGKAPRESGINDPFEARNRSVHAFNKALDKAILKPASKAYGSVARGPIATGVDNFASNLSLPNAVLNDLS